jgi:ankyrin repeat protein
MPLVITANLSNPENLTLSSHQLLSACMNGNLEMVKETLDSVPTLNPHQLFPFGAFLVNDQPLLQTTFISPFMLACIYGHAEIVEYCLKRLEHEIDVWHSSYKERYKNDQYPTEFYLACQIGHDKVVKAFLEYACPTRDKKLLEKTADYIVGVKSFRLKPNALYCLISPLATACYNGHVEVVRLLLQDERITNSHILNAHNNTFSPLQMACFFNHPDIVKLLLDCPGINIQATQKKKPLPLRNLFVSLGGNEVVFTEKVSLALQHFFHHVIKKETLDVNPLVDDDFQTIKAWINKMDPTCFFEEVGDNFTIRWETFGETEFPFYPKAEWFGIIRRAKQDVLQDAKNDRKLAFFALLVFISDGLLTPTKNTAITATQKKLVRFSTMGKDLPLELQMILCHRVAGSTGINIPANVSERAFRQLAKKI